MSKRAVSFADDIETRSYNRVSTNLLEEFDLPEGDSRAEKETENDDEVQVKKSKHTLDSDEEDNADDDKELDIKKVEGQEDCELDFDGTTKITAFNMKEDLEEGHFDGDGNFVYDKKEKVMKDAWLDDIDWASIKKKAGDQWEKNQEEEDDDLPAPFSETRKREIFTTLISILQSGQSVAKALTTLKKQKGLSAAEERKLRWAAKKAGKPMEESSGEKVAKQLSGLADELLTAGHMEAYEWSRERIEHMLQKMDAPAAVDELDMFSDAPAASSSASSAPATAPVDDTEDDVTWEYKESEDGEIQGPFSSSEMATRQEAGRLAAKGLARKNRTGGFNPVARIDFEIYC